MLARQLLIPAADYSQQTKHHIKLRYVCARTHREESIQIPAYAIGMVNGAVVLFGDYHPDQYWLPCVAVVLSIAPPSDEERAYKEERAERERRFGTWHDRDHDADQIRRRLEGSMFARMDEKFKSFTLMHEYDGYQQRFLPFKEIQQVTSREYHIIKSSWDVSGKPPKKLPKRLRYKTLPEDSPYRDQRKPLELETTAGTVEMREWLCENIFGRFYMIDGGGKIVFERYEDWLHARLRWSGT